MEITNQLLAAYAEGNVSNEERNAVRQYLTEHPGQLETVMMMMDEDYELEVDSEDDVGDQALSNSKNSSSDLFYNAYSGIFCIAPDIAPLTMPMENNYKSPSKLEKSNFNKRLDDLLDDIF